MFAKLAALIVTVVTYRARSREASRHLADSLK
jgi:hypothetical protein